MKNAQDREGVRWKRCKIEKVLNGEGAGWIRCSIEKVLDGECVRQRRYRMEMKQDEGGAGKRRCVE